jgi:hypothetical protein
VSIVRPDRFNNSAISFVVFPCFTSFATSISAELKSKCRKDNLRENGEIMSLICDFKLAKGNLNLRRETCIHLERPSIRADFFLARLPAIVLTVLWIFRQPASGACFYRKSILLARPPDDRLHLEFDNQAVLCSSLCLGLPNPSGMPNVLLRGRACNRNRCFLLAITTILIRLRLRAPLR